METQTTIYSDMGTEEIFNEELNAYLQYKLICTPDPTRSNQRHNKIYSILVIKIGIQGDSETCFLFDISRNVQNALKILNKILYGSVTPCAAEDIVLEMI